MSDTLGSHQLIARNCAHVSVSVAVLKGAFFVGNCTGMENAFQHRETVGVEDFVLLQDYRSEAAFVENLRKRFQEDLIYVSAIRMMHQSNTKRI